MLSVPIKQVHEQLIAHGAKARLCAEHLRFDETSMKMRLRDPESVELSVDY